MEISIKGKIDALAMLLSVVEKNDKYVVLTGISIASIRMSLSRARKDFYRITGNSFKLEESFSKEGRIEGLLVFEEIRKSNKEEKPICPLCRGSGFALAIASNKSLGSGEQEKETMGELIQTPHGTGAGTSGTNGVSAGTSAFAVAETNNANALELNSTINAINEFFIKTGEG